MTFRLSAAAIMQVAALAAPASADPYEEASAAYVSGHYATALQLWQPLANRGHSGAQFGLGLLYDLGRGVTKNDVVAYMWFDLAATRGKPGADRSRDVIAQHMTRAQITEAQKLASEWREESSNEGRIGEARYREAAGGETDVDDHDPRADLPGQQNSIAPDARV